MMGTWPSVANCYIEEMIRGRRSVDRRVRFYGFGICATGTILNSRIGSGMEVEKFISLPNVFVLNRSL